MFAVVYRFDVVKGKENDFRMAWKELTELIKEHEGSHGSRLHKSKEGHYIAYALWPNEEHFNKAGANLPLSADTVRKRMRSSCKQVSVLYKMETLEDLLN